MISFSLVSSPFNLLKSAEKDILMDQIKKERETSYYYTRTKKNERYDISVDIEEIKGFKKSERIVEMGT